MKQISETFQTELLCILTNAQSRSYCSSTVTVSIQASHLLSKPKGKLKSEIWCVCVQVEKELWAVACITLADKQQRESWGGSTLEDCSSYCFLAPHVSTHLKEKKMFQTWNMRCSNVRCLNWQKKKRNKNLKKKESFSVHFVRSLRKVYLILEFSFGPCMVINSAKSHCKLQSNCHMGNGLCHCIQEPSLTRICEMTCAFLLPYWVFLRGSECNLHF